MKLLVCVQVSQAICPVFALYLQPPALVYPSTTELKSLAFYEIFTKFTYMEKIAKSKPIHNVHCKVIIGRNPIEANVNTVTIQLPENPVAYIGKCFTPY